MDYSQSYLPQGSVTARHHNLAHLRTTLGPAAQYREASNNISNQESYEQNQMKDSLVKQLEITKNPNLYTYPEVVNYNEYDQFLKHQQDDRRDRHLLLRTDDIEGATHKMFKQKHKMGIKTSNFFPELPNVNAFYNKMNQGLEGQNFLNHNSPATKSLKAQTINLAQPYPEDRKLNSRGQVPLHARYQSQDEQAQLNSDTYLNTQLNSHQESLSNLRQPKNSGFVPALEISRINNQFQSNPQANFLQQTERANKTPLKNVYFSIQNKPELGSIGGSMTQRQSIDNYQNNQQSLNNRLNPNSVSNNLGLYNSQSMVNLDRDASYSKILKKQDQDRKSNYYPQVYSRDPTLSSLLEKNFSTSNKNYGNFKNGQEIANILEEIKSRRHLI
eukprot:403369339